ARLVGREGVGRRRDRVVEAPHHDRPIRVAFHEANSDLPTDAWQEHGAAGGDLGRAHPQARVIVVFAEAIPVELGLHAAVLVAVDLLPGGAGRHGALHAVNHLFGLPALRAVLRRLGRHGDESADVVAPTLPRALVERALAAHLHFDAR